MAAQLLAVAATAATSSDVIVAAGTPVTICLKDAVGNTGVPHGSDVRIQIKDDAGAYFQVGQLTAESPSQVLIGPGTYRLSRPASSASCGAFSA